MANKTGKKLVELEEKHQKMLVQNPEGASKICTELLALRKANPNWKELAREARGN